MNLAHPHWPGPVRRVLTTAAAVSLAAGMLGLAPVAVAPVAVAAGPSTTAHGAAPPRRVAGVVVNSAGRRLTNLRMDLVARGVGGGKDRFAVRTDYLGRFRLPVLAKRFVATRWTASAYFPWYDNSYWQRDLNTLSNRSTRLVFRADVTNRGAGSLADSVYVRPRDQAGCTSLWADPAYVASDPGTETVTLHFVPVYHLVDGSTTDAKIVTFPSSSLCDLTDIALPAGAWRVFGMTDGNRPLAFATDETDTHPSVRLLTLFDHPMSSSDELQYLDIRWATE
ncbi:hypothetical protein GON03_03350 [Nocardioides sp. MAH-18]|uniref:Uncharacterized protein n=1 Tax=Nocardioides agri TaxID=2682843 RepID=A0A6L6XLX5_9ACTN|nr:MULTISPECIES: hypothetical protein [unclassified Nocardioides]MBA2953336.1 hypothetical protein [Nocardioides sp. CGMCC 1.13656]MVQ48204.1 hypothetical protein [Nocardioides sp. MAH-18]